ncbi:GGDEF domain-containing protein [Pseudomonas fluorescens]|uniref:GGDEF domain-containing protein n=1 Tax=Pseudomonas fluorescens TaxID=294 RepID=A0A7Z6QKI2_PSEFL|nr:GGDEF domain-containing protein [Pseudomonas fluorescens]RDS87723.1 GGDEF domain-containing protein [Pseudomonas fluorescens]
MKDRCDEAENWLVQLSVGHVLEALSYAITCATLPEGAIKYCNNEFVRLFGHGESHFRTVDEFIERAFLYEYQRVIARNNWFESAHSRACDAITVPDMEVDVLAHDGVIRTVLHSGVVLPREKLCVAIFKDFSTTASSQNLLREIAYIDDLTGVTNRRGLRERWKLETHNDPEVRLAFLMLDLEDFKPINDCYGHEVEDVVLQVVAQRLERAIRRTDLVCRLGGDEFGILLVPPGADEQIQMVCDRILASVAEPITVGDRALSVGISIGGCLYPDQAKDKRELLQRADMALYQVKKTTVRGSWRWFSEATMPQDGSNHEISGEGKVARV